MILTIEHWDEWFALVGLMKDWAVVKDQFPGDVNRQLAWAQIMELNRITAETEKKKQSGVGC